MKRLGVVAVMFMMYAVAGAQNATMPFYANDENKRDVVSFTSKAPLETIVGTTGDIVGFVEVDPNNVSGAIRARFEVDLTTVKTGIGLRDQHMRDQYLETDKHPKAVFEMIKVVEASQNMLEEQKAIELTVEGTFSVHGITKMITIPLTITYRKESEATRAKLPGDLLRIEGTWQILLSDYKIKRPQFVLLKLDEMQKVHIDVFASTGSPAVSFASKSE